MKVRRLQVETMELARLRVQTERAQISIEAPLRRIADLQPQRTQMDISSESPSVKVDMTSLMNNIGLKDIGTLAQDVVTEAQAKAKQGIKEIENNGDTVAKLINRGNAIAQIARSRILEVAQPAKPRGAVDPTAEIIVNTGSLKIDWSTQDLKIQWDELQMPVISVDPKASVDISLAQKAHVEFKVVELSIPPVTGRNVDQRA